MRDPRKRSLVMKRSMSLGHCICNPRQPCPCEVLREHDLCPCAGERPDPPKGEVKLTRHVRKAGCASKISHHDLTRILYGLPAYDNPDVLVGMAAGDDAGIYRMEGEFNLVQTVDVFSPVVDDPYLFGCICAANSVSDIYAMGGRPICALSIIGFPVETLPHEVMTEILRGGLEKMHEAGVSVIGGHSINDEELKCGFAVTGLVRGLGAVTNAGAQPGDCLVLTKPLGTGFISFASQIGRASSESTNQIALSMATLNRDAAELMLKHEAHACTDVTGFSLAGHLSVMIQHSGVSAHLNLAQTPIFAEALGCVREDVIPGAVERNRESFLDQIQVLGQADHPALDLLFGPETSGGLLVSLPAGLAQPYVEEMHARGHTATAIIGEILSQAPSLIEVVLDEPRHLIGEDRLLPQSREDHTPFAPGEKGAGGMRSEEFSCCSDISLPPGGGGLWRGGSPGQSQESHNDKEQTMPETGSSAELFASFMKVTNAPGALDARTKRLLSIALSIAQRCKPCLKIHLKGALAQGLTQEEIDEAAWLAVAFCGCSAKMFYEEVLQEMAVA